MKVTNIISPWRFLLLLRRDILSNINTALIVFGAVTAIIYILSAINTYNYRPSDQLYFSFFTNILFIGGFVVTSRIFKEMHRKETAQNYLLLPASNFEKFLSRLLISTIGIAAITIIGVTAISYLSEGVNILIFKRHNEIFNPLTKSVRVLIAHYFVAQSLYFLGAVYFRKRNFIKTINAIFLFAISVLIMGILFGRMVYFDFFDGFFSIGNIDLLIHWEKMSLLAPDTVESLLTIAKILYWIVPAPLFWIISYFRIKEVEIKDAV